MRIVYYYDGAPLDIDNMIKPIQDALNGLVYEDDRQVSDLVAGKRSLNGSYRVRGMSQVLANGFVNGTDFSNRSRCKTKLVIGLVSPVKSRHGNTTTFAV